MNIESLRSPSEKLYLNIGLAIGGLAWLIMVIGVFPLLIAAYFAFMLWIAQTYFKAVIYGNAVKVSADQYPKIHAIVEEQRSTLGLTNQFDVFIVNGNGAMNALAVRFLSAKYIILFADLVDIMLEREEYDELKMVIGHELAHHAAGHLDLWKTVLLLPSKYVPFLGPAYSRACELTADRIGFELTQNKEASQRALINLVSGSKALATEMNVDAFLQQEREIPPFFGFLHEIYSTHPRMTIRIDTLNRL